MSNPFYERRFYADDWGSADAAYATAVAHFEELRAKADSPTTLDTKDSAGHDGVNRPLLAAHIAGGGYLFVMPTIVPDKKAGTGCQLASIAAVLSAGS